MTRLPLISFLLLSGCTSYQSVSRPGELPTPFDGGARYEFWSRGEAHQLHGVHAVGDSIVGVPWWKDPGCESCRVALARAEIDSVRAPRIDGNKTALLALLLVPVAVLIEVHSVMSDPTY